MVINISFFFYTYEIIEGCNLYHYVDQLIHDNVVTKQFELCNRRFINNIIQLLLKDCGLHRKHALINQKIIYESSLSVLSQ